MIKGLTDKGAMFPELGCLRKGAPKTDPKKPGEDLEYFRFDTKDEDAAAEFLELFGDQPREIEIKLPFHTTDENFEAWREEYAASGLKHRCDGETCTQWLDKKTGRYCFDPIPCPGGCKQTGRLKVIITALERFAYVTVTTTSIWDIITLHQNLMALEMLRGSLRGIPMILGRRERWISTPADGGKRERRKKWLLCVEAKPEWVKLELVAQERATRPPAPPRELRPWFDENFNEEAWEDWGDGKDSPEPGAPAGVGLEAEVEAPQEEMITEAQHAELKSIIARLRKLGVTNEKLAEGLASLTNGRASATSELTSADAAKVIHAWGQRLKEKQAEAERQKRAAA